MDLTIPFVLGVVLLDAVVTGLLVLERRQARRAVSVAHVQDAAAVRVLAKVLRIPDRRVPRPRRANGGEL